MDGNYFNKCVACTVKKCKFHSKENYCTLGKIVVSNGQEGTNCASFEKKDEN